MTAGGWFMMLTSVFSVVALTIWCYVRVLGEKQ